MPVDVDEKDYDDPVTTEDQLATTFLGIPPELLASSAPAAATAAPAAAPPMPIGGVNPGRMMPPADIGAGGESAADPMLGRAGVMPPAASTPAAGAIPAVPQHDWAKHQQLADNIVKLSQTTDRNDPRAQATLRQKIAAAIGAFGMGFGGNVGGGVALSNKIKGQNYENLEEDRKGQLQTAKEGMDQHEYDEGLKEKQFGDAMTGYRAQRQVTEDKQRDDDRSQRITDRETADANTPVGKPYQEKDAATGHPTGAWKQKTKSGKEIDVEPPAKKVYATPYERSQSPDPNEAKTGRTDYERDQTRKQAHEDEYESRTPNGKGSGTKEDKVAIRMYNQKAEKLKSAVDQATNDAEVAGKDWQKNPMMRREVKSAIDAYNNHVETAEDTPGVKAKEKIAYPWDNKSASANNPPTAPKDENRRATAAAAASAPKSKHNIGDVVNYGGKKYKIKSITNGKAELVPN